MHDVTEVFRGSGFKIFAGMIDKDAAVRVRAGEFLHCVKVREQPEGASPSWKYDYYAPGVGRILTTVAGKGFENPNTELISYQTQEGRP